MTEHDLSHVPSGSEPAAELLADPAAGENTEASETESEEVTDADDHSPDVTDDAIDFTAFREVEDKYLTPLLPRDLEKLRPELERLPCKSYASQYKAALAAGKLSRDFMEALSPKHMFEGPGSLKQMNFAWNNLQAIGDEIDPDLVERILLGVEYEYRRRAGDYCWRIYNNRMRHENRRRYEGFLHAGYGIRVNTMLLDELRRLVVAKFSEMPAGELSATMFLAANVDELVKVRVPNCEHAWMVEGTGRRDIWEIERCQLCGAVRSHFPERETET